MVWAAAGNLPEQNKNNECVNRPPETAVKKYASTYDLPCTSMAYEVVVRVAPWMAGKKK